MLGLRISREADKADEAMKQTSPAESTVSGDGEDCDTMISIYGGK